MDELQIKTRKNKLNYQKAERPLPFYLKNFKKDILKDRNSGSP